MIVVRTLTAPDEVAAFFRLATAAFDPDKPVEPAASNWRKSLTSSPCFEPDFVRGAFADGDLVGGCVAYHPRLRFGSLTLPTTGLGAVCTRSDYRRRGVARAVLADAAALAHERGDALLLLDGIPDFYGQFGYVDVVDNPDHAIDRLAVASLPPAECTVRPAVQADASTLLALYRRHYGERPGGFSRDLASAEHALRTSLPSYSPTVAVDARGEARGYLLFTWERRGARAGEVAADDWDAAAALLRWHANSVAAGSGDGEPPKELRWPLPLDSRLYADLRDRLPVRTEIAQRPNAGWMARATSPAALASAIAPLLRERAAAAGLREVIAVTVTSLSEDGPAATVTLGEVDTGSGAREVRLPASILAQLLFGFRSAEWAARQIGASVPHDLVPALAALFPDRPAFIAGSDAF